MYAQRISPRRPAIKITGEFRVTAPPQDVWKILMDPDAICRLATSCEEARRVDDTHYEGTVRAKIGFAGIRARIYGEVLEVYAPSGMVIQLHGETLGLPGTFQGRATLSMVAEGRDTHAHYSFDMDILGRLGTLGRPFFQMTAQHLANTFAGKMSAYLNTAQLDQT